MSTISTPAAAAPSNPGPGQGGGISNDPTSSSGLYLYTFLATLLLLLGISAAIVGRSILVRRRARRLMELAIANGTWIPTTPMVSLKLGDKPTLYDAHTKIDLDHGDASLKEKAALWDVIKPVSVTLVRSDNIAKMEQLRFQEPSSNLLHRQTPIARRLRFRTPALSPSPSASESQIPTSPNSTEYKTVTLTVMIAMPSPPGYRPHRHNKAEHECPAVEFGISDVELPTGWFMESRDPSTE